MDPRPYHYEYRRPRFSNPTFESGRLYQSIYHVGSYGKMFQLDKIHNNPSAAQLSPGFKINPHPQPDLVSQKLRQPDPYASSTRRNDYAGNYGQQPQHPPQGYPHNDYHKRSNGFAPDNNQAYPRDSVVAVNGERQGKPEWQNAYDRPQANQNIDSERPLGQERSGGAYHSQLNNYQKQKIEPRHQSVQRRSQELPMRETQYRRGAGSNDPSIQRRGSGELRSHSQDTPSVNSRQQEEMLSNYGSRLMKPMPGKGQDFIYERQQKPYNIISCYPREGQPKHRVFPKLTLQNKLIEAGQYPFANPERY